MSPRGGLGPPLSRSSLEPGPVPGIQGGQVILRVGDVDGGVLGQMLKNNNDNNNNTSPHSIYCVPPLQALHALGGGGDQQTFSVENQ